MTSITSEYDVNDDNAFTLSTSTNASNKDEDINMKLLVTNARSLAPKIRSFLEFFSEHEIDLAFVTESWLKDGQTLDRDIIDLEYGSGLQILYKNLPKKRATARKVGGGVSIIYDKSKCSFRER